MRIILTEIPLSENGMPNDVKIISLKYNEFEKFNNNEDVIAVVGSRAASRKCSTLNFPSLKLFQLTSAGFDGVPLEMYFAHGVAVANAGSVYSVPIAETVIFGMLQIAKKLRKNPNNRRFKLFRRYRFISELYEKRVLILGAGNIGTSVADRLLGFGMRIDAFDPYCAEKPQYERIIREQNELLSALQQYDYIVSTLPDNEQTKGFIDKAFLSELKSSAVIINVGRKSVIDENALYHALKTCRIAGAVLDIFEKVPNPVTNKFRRLKNVIVLPGVAAISQEVNVRLRDHICQNIASTVEGKQIRNVINGVE